MSVTPLAARHIACGWRLLSRNHAVRQVGVAGNSITAEAWLTAIGWIGELRHPRHTLRMPHQDLDKAIDALEAAEQAGPLCHDWCDGVAGTERWIHRIVDGRAQWAARAYGRYDLVVVELPGEPNGAPACAAFIDGEPVKEITLDWELDHPDEPEPPEDPNPFTTFSDPARAMFAAQQQAYSLWVDDPSTPGVTSGGLPGERELDNLAGDTDAVERAFASVR
jgi:hypothetical protein